MFVCMYDCMLLCLCLCMCACVYNSMHVCVRSVLSDLPVYLFVCAAAAAIVANTAINLRMHPSGGNTYEYIYIYIYISIS